MEKKILSVVMGCIVAVFISSCAPKKKPIVQMPEPTTLEEPDIRTGAYQIIMEIKNVNFDYNKSDLRSDAKTILKADADYLKKNTDLEILVEGHCDERGTIQYNMALGQRRASTVRNYLTSLGISAGRISTISYGEERPVNPGHDEDAWAQNRRADIKVRKIAAKK